MKIGLCLSGAGSKAFAHIGVLKAFEEENIKFDYLAGTSSGSIVATLYGSGYSADEIYNIFRKYARQIGYIDLKNICNIIKYFFKTGKIRVNGLNSGDKIFKLINKFCAKKGITNINQLDIPLIIPAVDICTENLYVFCSKTYNSLALEENIKYINDANIGAVVQSSCSYPRNFLPMYKI